MWSTPCESEDPDRYSRIRRKLTSQNYCFEIETSWLRSALQDEHAS